MPHKAKMRKQDQKHRVRELGVGMVGLIVSAIAILAFPDIAFAWVIAAVPLIWLGGCWLYSDSYDEWV
jgi:uncharacterized RDD family membrane protein YckC